MKDTPHEEGLRSEVTVSDDVEAVSRDVQERATVVIKQLRKEFPLADGTKMAAVDGLDLTMYSGQITAFLGHNGAGNNISLLLLLLVIPLFPPS